jgi:hypothetical protein
MDSITVYFKEPLRTTITKTGKDLYMYELGSHTIFKEKGTGTGEDHVVLSVVTFEMLYVDWG